MSCCDAVKEAVWLKQLLTDLRQTITNSITLRVDNQGSIALAKNPVDHAKSKHIDIRYHYVREKVEAGTVELKYCATEDMAADILTKSLAKAKHERGLDLLGMKNCDLSGSVETVETANQLAVACAVEPINVGDQWRKGRSPSAAEVLGEPVGDVGVASWNSNRIGSAAVNSNQSTWCAMNSIQLEQAQGVCDPNQKMRLVDLDC